MKEFDVVECGPESVLRAGKGIEKREADLIRPTTKLELQRKAFVLLQTEQAVEFAVKVDPRVGGEKGRRVGIVGI